MLAIDLASNSTQLRLQFLVLLDLLSARHSHLNEHDLIAQFRVVVQECVECLQLLREALDMVQSVHSNDDLEVFILLFQGLNAFLHFGPGEGIGELLRVDPHDEFVCADESTFILDLVCKLGLCSTGTGEQSASMA